MGINVYVDGSGGTNGGYGFFVKETGESFYEKEPDITNNQAEYKAIISALKKYVNADEEIIIFSDSKNTVSQLNHEFAINNEKLRELAREAWEVDRQIFKFDPHLDSKKRQSGWKNAGKLIIGDQKFP